MRHATHERLVSDESAAAIGSHRAFGIVFAVVFAAIGLWPLPGGGPPRGWALAAAAALLAVALVRATWLAPQLTANRRMHRLQGLMRRRAHPVNDAARDA